MKNGGKPKVHVMTLGCAKNTVDSEKLMAQLHRSGMEITPSLEDAEIAIINTCGFIGPAKEESVDAIIESVRLKSRGKLRKVYAMGCLTERYMADLAREIPEVDRFFGSHQPQDIVEELGGRFRQELLGERLLTTPPHTAFLKISEGCDRPCSFCAIPLMRGKHVSRPTEEILTEARLLAERGVRELVVIAQDTTSYGLDLDGQRRLPDLLERLAVTEGIEWVRLMYAYPAQFPLDALDIMAQHPSICRYLDIPLQHISDRVLRSMRRGISSRSTRELLDEIRTRLPGIALRTTLIVGYPEEGPAEFDELVSFVEEMRFHRLGVFPYSREEGTPAHPLGDPVSRREKERRVSVIMELQREISEGRNAELVGTRQRVLLDREDKGTYVGRTEWDAPEIDNEVFIRTAQELTVGTFFQVDIVESYEYDLVGSVTGESKRGTV